MDGMETETKGDNSKRDAYGTPRRDNHNPRAFSFTFDACEQSVVMHLERACALYRQAGNAAGRRRCAYLLARVHDRAGRKEEREAAASEFMRANAAVGVAA